MITARGISSMGPTGIPSVYDPAGVEEKWYKHWLDKCYFRAPYTWAMHLTIRSRISSRGFIA